MWLQRVSRFASRQFCLVGLVDRTVGFQPAEESSILSRGTFYDRVEVHLGARMVWDHEVAGSTPANATDVWVVEDWLSRFG